MQEQYKLPKFFTDVLNQVFELEKKINNLQDPGSLMRNVNRIKESFESLPAQLSNQPVSIRYKDPIGEKYDETRTDCDANIAGTSTENLIITEVIKPIIYMQHNAINHIIQKGVVVVEGKNK